MEKFLIKYLSISGESCTYYNLGKFHQISSSGKTFLDKSVDCNNILNFVDIYNIYHSSINTGERKYVYLLAILLRFIRNMIKPALSIVYAHYKFQLILNLISYLINLKTNIKCKDTNERILRRVHIGTIIKSRKVYFNIHLIINLTRHNFDIAVWT